MHRYDFACVVGAVCTVAAVTVAAPSHAQITPSGGGYVFRNKYTKGETINYVITADATTPQGVMKTATPLKMKVLTVTGDVAEISVTTGPVSMNGSPFGQAQTTVVKVNRRGGVVGGAAGGMQNLATSLPDKPLKVGGSFTNDATVNQMGQTVHTTATATFNGIKTVGGRQVAVLTVRTKGSVSLPGGGPRPGAAGAPAGGGTMPISGTNTMLLSTRDGLLVSVTGEQQVMLGNMKIVSKTRVQRQ